MPTRAKPKASSTAKRAGPARRTATHKHPTQPAARTKRTQQASTAAGAFTLQVQYAAASDALPTRTQLRRWVRAALTRPAQITLRVVDVAEGRALNHQFRGKDYATNVLTFVYHEPMLSGKMKGKSQSGKRVQGADRAGTTLCGDIVLCAPVVEQEARAQGKPATAHYAHLTVHGVLHLQGYDHLRSAEAKRMEQIEIDTLAKLGYPDPYRSAYAPHA